ncbi:MAG TPA: DUF6531 domain-containing protein, partial [Fimbriimonadales bacterium]|nr:DUF6531 domain-containing protein [Fimbriimonadales bacterium]
MGSTLALPKPNKKGPATLLPKPAVLLLPFLSVSTAFALGGILNPPPLSPAPGPAYPWQPSFPVYSGSANIATGNLTLMHNICGWGSVGPSTSFRLIFNSQSSDTGTLGSKWMHSYGWKVTAGNPAIVTYGDGRRVSFSLVGASYVPPSYIHETLTNHIGGGYDLTFKNGTVYVFNSAGKLTSITDLNGNTAALAYTSGNLTSVTDAVGRVLAIGYTSGKITSVTDAESRVWTLTYDASGRLEKVIMPLDGGNSYFTKFTYNTDNDVATITDRLNHTWTYDYSANDCFSTCTDPLSGIRGYVAVTPGMLDPNFTSAQPELTILPDQNNGTFSLDTDSTVYLQNEAGNAIQFGMDENGRMTAFRDSLGNQTNFTYDTSNNRTSIIEPGTQATQFTYDAKGNVLTVKDPLQHTTT